VRTDFVPPSSRANVCEAVGECPSRAGEDETNMGIAGTLMFREATPAFLQDAERGCVVFRHAGVKRARLFQAGNR
jgi:hypothetical protein